MTIQQNTASQALRRAKDAAGETNRLPGADRHQGRPENVSILAWMANRADKLAKVLQDALRRRFS